jgi:murein endopeptidase
MSALCGALVWRSVAADESQEVNVELSAPAEIHAELDESPVAEVENPSPAPRLTSPAPITVTRLDDAAFDAAWGEDPSRLGAVAAGRPNRGFLYNGARLPNDGVFFKLEEPENAYGTEETIAGLTAAVAEVHRLFPGTKPLSVGHVSRAMGGWLKPHKSHQNGRDADIGFYYIDDSPWYRRATAENLDVARTWALISAMERAAGIEYLFVDRSLHDVLRKHAEEIGEPPEFIEHLFDGPMPVRGPTIRHARGHQTHLHVRFASPVAVENSQRVAKRLGKAGRNSGQLVQLLRQQDARQAKPKATKLVRVRPRSHATAKASHSGASANVKAL